MSRRASDEERKAADNMADEVSDFLGIEPEEVMTDGAWVCLKAEDMSRLLHLAELAPHHLRGTR